MDQQNLFGFIDSIQMQMREVKVLFFQKWNALIKEHLNIEDHFSMEQIVGLCGGYWLEEASYIHMDDVLKSFFGKRAKKYKGKFFLRGYDYYQADPLMHCQDSLKNLNNLWNIFQVKWDNYPRSISFAYLNDSFISVENWIGTLGLLEYLFTDLTSLQWFAFKNKDALICERKDDYYQAMCEMEYFADKIGEAIASTLQFDFKRVYAILSETYVLVTGSKYLDAIVHTEIMIKDKSSVRAIREGDSISLIYASYLMKLKPFCQAHHFKKIQLVSNAFGAMNIGIIFKYLVCADCEADSYNILYAQNRAEEDIVYGNTQLDSCCVIGDSKETFAQDSQGIFVVDDSIFSGNSYRNIKEFLGEESVYLLPLTFNCDCIKYCRRGIKETDDMEQIAQQAAAWASEVGDLPPAFASFWDFERKALENKMITDNQELRRVLDGDDLILKHLWVIFQKEILQKG